MPLTGSREKDAHVLPGLLTIRAGMTLKGNIRNCREAEIDGYVEGEIEADVLRILPRGRFVGTARVGSAEILGDLQGDVRVAKLMTIRSTGSVTGNVRYGQLAMDVGAKLSANVRNIPPALAGDLELTVGRGQSVRIALEDLNAYDPDDTSENLRFTVTRVTNGAVIMIASPGRPITAFSQSDLEGGRVAFAHNGSAAAHASFDVIVQDASGATSEPQTVRVAIV